MKKLLALLLLLASPAYAADVLPVKSAANIGAPCTVQNCTGLYVGFNFAGTATNANILANGINGSLAAGGQSIGGQVGYQFWNGTWFFGPEVSADYTYAGSPVVAGFSAPKYLFMEVIKFGTPLSTFFGGITAANQTGLPALLTANTISPYLFVGAAQRDWGTGIASGGGVAFAIDQQHWFVDARYTNIQYTGSNQASPVQTVPQENIISVGLNYKF